MNKKKSNELVSNRKAYHNYEILETYEAGISLMGSEIKSLRNHGGSLQDAYITIDNNNEIWLISCSIAPYQYATSYTHEDRRKRKLLMHAAEIEKLRKLSQEKGIALIPISLYLKNGRVKVKVACAKGKKLFDKRAVIKEREQKKVVERAIKSKNY